MPGDPVFRFNRRSAAAMARAWPGAQWQWKISNAPPAAWSYIKGLFDLFANDFDENAAMVFHSNRMYWMTTVDDEIVRTFLSGPPFIAEE